MVTYKELNYRTLDQLVDSVRIDLKAFSIDGNIEIQELIKIAQECNYELGLPIQQNKETILEIEHGAAKLPADFSFLNYALLCHTYEVVTPGPNSGNMTIEQVICTSGCTEDATPTCNVSDCAPIPCRRGSVYTICDNSIGIQVMHVCSTETRRYQQFSPVYMLPSRQVSDFMDPRRVGFNVANQAMLNRGFMKFAVPCGRVYINYMGILEDETTGELLVLDHPRINSYYEWAMKKRIIANLYINGEPDLERRLQYVDTEYQKAKLHALTIVNTPDHRVMQETFQIIRKNAAQRFAAPVSRFYGTYNNISFIDKWANQRYAE